MDWSAFVKNLLIRLAKERIALMKQYDIMDWHIPANVHLLPDMFPHTSPPIFRLTGGFRDS